MGFRLAVSGGAESISLDERTIEKVSFGSDSAADSNARATDFGIAVIRSVRYQICIVMKKGWDKHESISGIRRFADGR